MNFQEKIVQFFIIFDPIKNVVLSLDWEKFNWKTFVIGGIENNEDPVVAAMREIQEETGYKNIKFITDILVEQSLGIMLLIKKRIEFQMLPVCFLNLLIRKG